MITEEENEEEEEEEKTLWPWKLKNVFELKISRSQSNHVICYY